LGTLIIQRISQLIMYASVGVVGTVAQYGILITLVTFIKVQPVTSSTYGFIIGALINYFLNYKMTFRSPKRHSDAMPKFFLVALSGLFLNLVIMIMATELFLMNYIVGQIIATGSVLLSGFVINNLWTFGR